MQYIGICFVLISLTVNLSNCWELGWKKRRRVVQSEPSVQLLTPYYSDFATYAGKRIAVKCRVRSDGPPDIQWFKRVEGDGSSITDNLTTINIDNETFVRENRTKYFTKRRNIFVLKLYIRKSGIQDSGLYACRIYNKESQIIKKFNIKIYERKVIPVRLSSFTNDGEGRLEVYYFGRWGSICHFNFETPEASTICKMLGYSYGGTPRFQFEEKGVFRSGVSGWIQQKPCPLNGTDIGQCAAWQEDKTCRYDYTVGITCKRKPEEVPSVPVRFTGISPEDGQIEIYWEGYWGRVCSDGFGENEVATLCRMLGYNYGGRFFNTSSTLLGGRPILIQGLVCPVNSTSLSECNHSGWRQRCKTCTCNFLTNVALDCKTYQNEDEPGNRVRLSASSIPHEGRLEVFYNGTWGTVARRWLEYEGANAMCKTMGYEFGGVPLFEGIQPGLGVIWIDYMKCPLNASSIDNCRIDWGKTKYRGHSEDVGVRCRTQPIEVPDFPLRIIGPKYKPGEGKLEIFRDGYWGMVCGAYMGTLEANVFCNMLGFRNGGHILPNPDSYPILRWDNKPILLKYLDCPVGSSSLDDCTNREWGYPNYILSCTRIDHAKDVVLKCRDEPFPEIPVMITNGPSEREGLLESFTDGQWFSMCGGSRDPRVISVVCRQLGFRHGGEITRSYFYNRDERSKPNIEYIECSGKETNIGHCNSIRTSTYCWTPDFPVKCYNTTESEGLTVILVNDDDDRSGRVVIVRGDKQWDICVEWWDDIHATAVCKMLGFRGGKAKYMEYEPPNSRTKRSTIKKMYCGRGVNSLGDCFHSGWNDNECYPSYSPYRAGVVCT